MTRHLFPSLLVVLTALSAGSAARADGGVYKLKINEGVLKRPELLAKFKVRPLIEPAGWRIDDVVPPHGRPGDVVTVVGDGFSQMQSSASVVLPCGLGCTGTGEATILSMTDDEIVVELPDFTTGPVSVGDTPGLLALVGGRREIVSSFDVERIGLTTIRNQTGLEISSLVVAGVERIPNGYVLPHGNQMPFDLPATAQHGQGDHAVVAVMTSIPLPAPYTLTTRVDAGDTLVLEILDHQLMGRGCSSASVWQGSYTDGGGLHSFQLLFGASPARALTFRELGPNGPLPGTGGTYAVGPGNPLLLWTVTLMVNGQPPEDDILDDASGTLMVYVNQWAVPFSWIGCQ